MNKSQMKNLRVHTQTWALKFRTECREKWKLSHWFALIRVQIAY